MSAVQSAKGKLWSEMDDQERRAFVEAICLKAVHVAEVSSSTPTRSVAFFKLWADKILVFSKKLSESDYMKRYKYGWRDASPALLLEDNGGYELEVTYNLKELKLFVYNAINEVPFRSPIISYMDLGVTAEDIKRKGVDSTAYGSLTDVKLGASKRKDSLRQRILRGEITRYEAYEKGKRVRDRKIKLTDEQET
jgi:hypothetical protein